MSFPDLWAFHNWGLYSQNMKPIGGKLRIQRCGVALESQGPSTESVLHMGLSKPQLCCCHESIQYGVWNLHMPDPKLIIYITWIDSGCFSECVTGQVLCGSSSYIKGNTCQVASNRFGGACGFLAVYFGKQYCLPTWIPVANLFPATFASSCGLVGKVAGKKTWLLGDPGR